MPGSDAEERKRGERRDMTSDNRALYTSNTDQWATPQYFFDDLDREFHFDLDPCADETNHKCERYFTKEQDGLSQNWGGTGCFAIRLTGEIYQSGCKKRMRKAKSLIRLSLCLFMRGLIRDGSMIGCTAKRS